MKKSQRRFVSSKWLKTKALLLHPRLRPYVPATRRFTRRNLRDMLERYGMIYAKPNTGSWGNGVIRIEKRTEEGRVEYQYQLELRKATFSAFSDLYRSLCRVAAGRTYLLQRGIHMLKHENQMFDLRLVVQQNPAGRWEATGTVGRVAAPERIVTNGMKGASFYLLPEVLRPHVQDDAACGKLLARINRIGLETAQQMRAIFTGIKEIGLDIALDEELRPWILEVNTRPNPMPFGKLEDKNMYRKMVKYTRAYSRSRAKR